METLLILYVSNLILDYPLQGSFLAEYKSKNNYILFVHCAIWAFGLSVVIDGLNYSVECGLWHPGTDSSLAFFKDKKCVASSM